MEETNIRSYAKLMEELDLTALEISENGKTVRLERAASAYTGAAVPVMAAAAPAAELSGPAAPAEEPGIVNVNSPMVGVFYTSAAENQRPFVNIGDTVRKGEVLCIIEAMKLMNEIVSEYDGTVVEICAGNQQVVDYGHVLFRIKKEGP